MRFDLILALAVGALLGSCASSHEPVPAQDKSLRNHAVWGVLDALHASASDADFDRYFDQFAPDGIFLGTDGTERWTIEEFQAYTRPYFDQGRGWTYVSRDRSMHFSADGRTAWFDELLDNAKYGECRGSGVLVYGHDGRWRIAQYNLAKTVPNDRMEAVVGVIGAAR